MSLPPLAIDKQRIRAVLAEHATVNVCLRLTTRAGDGHWTVFFKTGTSNEQQLVQQQLTALPLSTSISFKTKN